MILQQLGNRGMRLGELFDIAAERHPYNLVQLDHDLELAPGAGRSHSVQTLSEIVIGLATDLIRHGVGRGEHVAVYHRNSFDIALVACAIARIGAVPVLLSPFLDVASVDAMLRRVPTPWVIADPGRAGSIDRTALGDRVLITSGTLDGARRLAVHTADPVPPVWTAPDDPILVTHTSGTTGVPKMAVHTRRSLQSRYRPQAVGFTMVRGREATVIHVSFVHSRMYSALTLALRRGFPLLILADPDPEQAARAFASFRPGIIEAHPNTFMEWEEIAASPLRPFANVKYFSSTFDALHPRTIDVLLAATNRRLPLFAQLYGQSETGPVVARTYTRRRRKTADARCVGIPLPGMTAVRVVPRDGHAPSAEHPGFIEVRTAGRAVDYLGEHERYAEMVDQHWWRMGDVGYKTRLGCLHMLDREIDLVKGVGSTLVAEDLLLQRLPELVEVVIVAGVDGRAQPIVCTRDDSPIDAERWQAAAADLGTLNMPLQCRRDELPHTATEKVKRVQLRAELARVDRATPQPASH